MGWSNGEKVWISKLFDTMNKLWKEEKAKVGDIFDNRNSGIIWKSRLLWWCIIDDPQPYWCLGKIWKFGWGSHFKRRIVCKSWLMRRWARCWKRESLHQGDWGLGINQLDPVGQWPTSVSDRSAWGRTPAKLRISHRVTPNAHTSDFVVYRPWKSESWILKSENQGGLPNLGSVYVLSFLAYSIWFKLMEHVF